WISIKALTQKLVSCTASLPAWVLLVVGLFLKMRTVQRARQPLLGYGIQRQSVSRSPMGAMKLPLFYQSLDLSFCNSPNPLSQSIGARTYNSASHRIRQKISENHYALAYFVLRLPCGFIYYI